MPRPRLGPRPALPQHLAGQHAGEAGRLLPRHSSRSPGGPSIRKRRGGVRGDQPFVAEVLGEVGRGVAAARPAERAGGHRPHRRLGVAERAQHVVVGAIVEAERARAPAAPRPGPWRRSWLDHASRSSAALAAPVKPISSATIARSSGWARACATSACATPGPSSRIDSTTRARWWREASGSARSSAGTQPGLPRWPSASTAAARTSSCGSSRRASSGRSAPSARTRPSARAASACRHQACAPRSFPALRQSERVGGGAGGVDRESERHAQRLDQERADWRRCRGGAGASRARPPRDRPAPWPVEHARRRPAGRARAGSRRAAPASCRRRAAPARRRTGARARRSSPRGRGSGSRETGPTAGTSAVAATRSAGRGRA